MFADAFGYDEASPKENRFDDNNALFGERRDSPALYAGHIPGIVWF